MPTSDPRQATSDPPFGPGGLDAVRELGAEILAAVDLEAISARLLQLPTGALLNELDAMIAAVDHADPARSRRRAGWWGRLLGRDLVAQAQPDPLDTRLRLHLSTAQAHADALALAASELDRMAKDLQQEVARLEALISRARTDGATDAGHDDALARRLIHLALIAASWRETVAQIALVRTYAGRLLDRHVQVRDVFATLWQERQAAQAAASRLSPEHRAHLHQALRELRAAALTFPASAADPDRPTQEPSP